MATWRPDCRPWLELYCLNFPQLVLDARKTISSELFAQNETSSPEQSEDEDGEKPPAFDFWKLPAEVVHKILSALHGEQLSALAQVSRDWRSFVYEPRHWEQLALRTWPFESRHSLEHRLYQYGTWRKMVQLRPRLRPNGIYIVRNQFCKPSTRVMAAEPIAPVFLVTYHRLFRFYCDGTVVSLTTPEPLDIAYQRLKRWWKPAHNERDKAHPSKGRFEFDEETRRVSVTLPMTQAKYPNMREGTLFYQFSVDGTHPGSFNRLTLRDHYAVIDHDTEDKVKFGRNSFGAKPMQFVSIWGFRTEVFKHFPRDDVHVAKWSTYAMPVSH